MANKQIYELNNAGNDLDNSALLAMDIPNPDSSAASEIPYVTRKASINVLENQFLGEDEYTTELNTENQTIFGSINEVLTYAKNIAEEYDDTATYAVGDFVTYEGVLYKCIVAIAVAESWDSTHWDSTLIVEEFGQGGGGASVTLGTTTPSDASGSNGDLYVQYDGTSYAAVYAYVKINNSWRKFPYAKVVALTQAEYDLITPDPTTLYIITDKQGSYVKLPVITDAYDSTSTYNTGDLCIYNDTLYKCNDDNVTGTWDAQYWDATSIADEINELNTGLSGVEAYRCKYDYTPWGSSKGSEYTHVPFFRVQIDLDYYIASNGGDYINIRNLRTGTTQSSQIPSGQTSVSVTVDGYTFTKNVSDGKQNLVITTSSYRPIFIEYYL